MSADPPGLPPLDSAADFAMPDRDDWLAAVENVLRGRSFDDVLVSTTRDGIDIQPLYTADGSIGATSVPLPVDEARVRHGWDVRQQHSGNDPDACGQAILADLERGATSVEILGPDSRWTLDSLRRATDGVLFAVAGVALFPHADVNTARTFHALIADRGGVDETRSWLGLDPVGEIARGGFANAADVVAVAAELAPALPNGRTLTVDTTRYSEAGGSEAQELGWSLATAVYYLRLLEAAGIGPEAGAATIAFRLSVGREQFLNIAMLRSARRLWARVLDACGVAAGTVLQVQHAVTSRAMFSQRDPWVNMLRGTSAALSAGVGGADSVTVLPFDDAVGMPDDFARRVARNTQALLIEESHLARVIDPAAGSWFVESLTERLSAAAWEVFTATESAGGIEAVIEDGSLVAAIDERWADRLARLATRRDPVTGVSEFPLLDEPPLTRPPRPPEAGLPIRRLAAPFEELRDASDRHLAEHGSRPVVHLATLGDLATHGARTTWITNLLAAGGIAAIGGDGDGSLSPLEAEARFSENDATVAVICSSDGVYAERAAATATALKEAGAAAVILAGRPGDLQDELEAAGVDEFWYVGIDVLDALRRVHILSGLTG